MNRYDGLPFEKEFLAKKSFLLAENGDIPNAYVYLILWNCTGTYCGPLG